MIFYCVNSLSTNLVAYAETFFSFFVKYTFSNFSYSWFIWVDILPIIDSNFLSLNSTIPSTTSLADFNDLFDKADLEEVALWIDFNVNFYFI